MKLQSVINIVKQMKKAQCWRINECKNELTYSNTCLICQSNHTTKLLEVFSFFFSPSVRGVELRSEKKTGFSQKS